MGDEGLKLRARIVICSATFTGASGFETQTETRKQQRQGTSSCTAYIYIENHHV